MAFCKLCGMHSSDSLIIGCAFALSSTAIVLQVLQESGMQSNQVGRLSVAVLLMQDFTVDYLFLCIKIHLLYSLAKEKIQHISFCQYQVLSKLLSAISPILTKRKLKLILQCMPA